MNRASTLPVIVGAVLAMTGAAVAQPISQDLGTLTIPTVVGSNQTMQMMQVKWYRFIVPEIADPGAFLDITTSGTFGDTEIGLYDEFGALRASDDDDGPGSYSSLTFGLASPTRNNGDGAPHDGRDGSLPAGLYYLAVAGYNATFSFDFDVLTDSESTGSVTTTLRTGGGVLPPPANDTCVNAIDLGPGPYPVVSSAVDVLAAAPSSEVAMCASSSRSVWFRVSPNRGGSLMFSTCADAATLCTVPDTVLEVYSSPGGDCSGDLTVVGCGDNTCAARASVVAAVSYGPTYFVQVAVAGTNAPSAGASNLQLAVIPVCGSADFNNDGDTGTDLDIEAFFACLGGNCCSGCSADFNFDGDTGTDLDIEAFFRVLGGGTC